MFGTGTLQVATELHAVRHMAETQSQALAPAAPSIEFVPPPVLPSRVTPLSLQRYELRTCVDQETQELLAQARELLGHAVPNGDMGEIRKRALKLLLADVERRRFAMTERSRPGRASAQVRHIPAEVRRVVLLRDGGRCTFVSESGHRCNARRFLEFDHIEPVARGGRSTVDNVRLLCHGHNQLEARRKLGEALMDARRDDARVRTRSTRSGPPRPPHHLTSHRADP